MTMYPRYIWPRVEEALQDTPVVLISGPRQSGKSTLARLFCEQGEENRAYYTFDDQATLNAAVADPAGFVRSLPDYVVLDEVQRAPELFVSIKRRIDEQRSPGQFLLTGSANIMVLPTLSDSLVGRIEVIPLMPLSEVEILGTEHNFIDALLAGDALPAPAATGIRDQLIQRIVTGCYPEPLARGSARRVSAWQQQYITTTIQRDVKTVSDIDRLSEIPNLIGALTNHTGQLLVVSEISKMLGIPRKTVDRYINILRNIYLVDELKPWFSNRNKRLVKTPKVHVMDTGIGCRAINVNAKTLDQNSTLLGHLLETFLFNELRKQASWCSSDVNFYYYRDMDQYEADYVLETDAGFIAMETKLSATVRKPDFKGIERFARQVEQQFVAGILFYDGDHVLPFGEKLWAVPIACIWSSK